MGIANFVQCGGRIAGPLLAAGGLAPITEAHVGFLVVPLQTLPRLGARVPPELYHVDSAKFLTWRFATM